MLKWILHKEYWSEGELKFEIFKHIVLLCVCPFKWTTWCYTVYVKENKSNIDKCLLTKKKRKSHLSGFCTKIMDDPKSEK